MGLKPTPRWKEKLSAVTEGITAIENSLKGACIEVSHEGLTWTDKNEQGKFRIMLGERPLVECKVLDRVKNHKSVARLAELVDAAMDEFMDGNI